MNRRKKVKSTNRFMARLYVLGMVLVSAFLAAFGIDIVPPLVKGGRTWRAKRKGLAAVILRLRGLPYLTKVRGLGDAAWIMHGAPIPSGGADPTVDSAVGLFGATVGSTAFKPGDLVYFDGTDWELADADDNTKYAEAIATSAAAAGAKTVLCTECIVRDTDSPYTQGSTYYLTAPSGDPSSGNHTATRPTGAVNLKQVVGFGLSSTELRMQVGMVREQTIWVDLPYAEGSAAVTADGDWSGLSMTADADAAHGTQQFPENTVGIVIAYLWSYNEDTLAGGSYTVDVSAGVSDESGTGTTDGITATAVGVLTADDLVRSTITTAFDATGIVEPGNHFGVDVAKASETAADDYRYHGVAIVLKVV